MAKLPLLWLRCGVATCLLLLLAAMPAGATFGHRHDPDRIRIISATDAPDPFLPPGQSSTLSVKAAIRKLSGLGDLDRDDDDDCDEDRGGRRNHRKSFQVTVRWTIRQGHSLVRQLEKSVEVRPPLEIVRLPTHGRRSRKFALVPVELPWDGRRASGQVASPGTYSWEAEALFTRTHEHRNRTHVKLIESETVRGSVTIAPPVAEPVVTVAQPQAGFLTGATTIAVTGSVSGQAPLTVKINGVSAAVGATTYAGSATLVEGANTITVVATDGGGRTAQAVVTVTRDSVAPAIQVSAPATGSTTLDATPDFVIEYSDPAPGSGVDTATLSWALDGASLAASTATGATRSVVTPTAPIAAGQHEFTASISDRAGGRATASTTFTIQSGKPAPPSVGAFPATTNVPAITLAGGKPANTALLVNGVERVALSASTTWTTTKTLFEGFNSLVLQTRGSSGLDSDPVTVGVTLDSVPPPPPSVNPAPSDVTAPTVTLSGTKLPGTAIVINGTIVVPLSDATTWSVPVTLRPGENNFIVEAQDAAGNRSITQGGQVAGVVRSKPVIGNLTVSPALVPTGQPVTIAYKLFAQVPPADNADLRVNISIEDGDQLVRTVFSGVQQGSPTGQPYTVTWNGRDEAGQLVPVNTSYRVVVSADRDQPTTQPPELVNANPKESAVTVTGSSQVVSTDAKLRVVFRPDDARLKIDVVSQLSKTQTSVLVRRKIRALGRPYRITVDRAFTSPVVGLLAAPHPVGQLLRAYRWDETQQDWMPIARTTWNAAEKSLAFAMSGQGLFMVGSTPDAEAPRVTAFATPTGVATIRVADRGSGINPARTRVRCRGADITASAQTQNVNGTREQVVTTTDAAAATGGLLIYLEDWAGNGRLHRVGRR